MKKFYISIFATALLLVGISSQAQTFNSIFANPTGLTFDDPQFWIGPVPPNPCTGCFINVNSSTTMVPTAALSSNTITPTTNVLNGQAYTGGPHRDGTPPAFFSVTVGMKFQSTVAGQVLGVSFWKTPEMDSTHVGALYDINGNLLASVDIANTPGSNVWKTANFAAPVTIQPGVTYILAVFMANGWYAFTDNNVNLGTNFTTAIQNGNMIGVADASPGNPNSTYAYGNALTFPTTFFTPGTNYWVDVNFAATPYNFADVVFNNSTIHTIGDLLNLEVSTVTHLNGTSLTVGNEPNFTQNLFVNDQMFLDPASTIQLANTHTTANTNNDAGHTPLVGTFNFLGGGVFPGIYTVRSASPGPDGATDATLSLLLNSNFDGSYTGPVTPYTLNCTTLCSTGIVFGPAITQYDAINNFYGFIASNVLPVVLVQLIATRNDDGSIKVSWATSQEENAGYYDVERSSDQSGWTKIGTVKAKGYSSTTTNYSFTDRLPLDGTGYYRLKMTDLDGKFTYSKTISVADNNTKVPLVIYSNPFSDQIRLKVNVSRSQNLVMTVSDMMGKTYLSQSYHAQSGDNFVNLLPSLSASGMYILRIHGDSYDQTVKLEKQ